MGEEGGGENIKKNQKKRKILKSLACILNFQEKQWQGLNASNMKLKFGLSVIRGPISQF